MIKISKGTISIFLSLIIIPVYSFAILFMDIAKIVVSNNHLNTANEIVSYSVESSFNEKLYEKYGIFGIDKDKNILNQYVNYLLRENVEKDQSNIYHAIVDSSDLTVKDEDLLLSNNNLENQILEYMKLMGPYQIANGVFNLINIVMSSKKYTGILKNKLDYEEEYSKSANNLDVLINNFILYDTKFVEINNGVFKLNLNLDKLKKDIKGIKSKFVEIENKGLDKKIKIEKINEDSKKLLNDNKNNIIILYKLTNKDIKNIENIEFINLIRENKSIIEKIYPYSKVWNIDDKLVVDDKVFDVSIALDKIFKYNLAIKKTYNDKINKIVYEYNMRNAALIENVKVLENTFNKIISELENLSENSVLLEEKLNKWGKSIDEIDQGDIKNNFNSEYKSTKIMFTKENIDKLLEKLIAHKETLPNIIKEINNKLELFKFNPTEFDSLFKQKFNLNNITKLPSLKNFKIYKYAMDKKNDSKIDNSKKKIAIENKKNIEKFGTDNKNSLDENSNETIFSFVDRENLEKIINNSKEKINFVNGENSINNYLKIFNQSSELIPSDRKDIIDELYLSQYIVDKFYNKLTDSDFRSQIEYILFGKESLSSNNNIVNNFIFGIRFLLNSLYAYTNTDLKLEANAIAIAIAGWTGFAVPLIRTLVLSSMSFGESVLDLEKINKDKYIETFKNKSSWQVSVTSIPSLLAKGTKDLINSSLENIYDSIINFSNEGINYLKNNVDEFANQTIDGISQSIISEIVSPLQTIIFNNINQKTTDTKSQIAESLNYIKLNLENNKDELYFIKKSVFDHVRNSINSNMNKFEEINLEKYFNKLIIEIENSIKTKTTKFSNTLKNKINSSIQENKIKQKELFNKYIDEYLDNLGLDKKITNMGSTSGLSFKYKDYLTLVALFRLLTGNKNQILRRLAIIIDYEMKKEFSEFDITKVFVSFSIDSKLRINTNLLNKYIFMDIVKNTIIGGY